MQHNDELASAVVGISMKVGEKAVDLGAKGVDKIFKLIGNLFKGIFKLGEKINENKKNSDMKDLKGGINSMQKFISAVKKGKDNVISQDGYSAADVKYIAKEAKKYGIPIAVTGKGDNFTIHVRSGGEADILKNITTEMVKEKIRLGDGKIGNIKFDKKDTWQAPYLNKIFAMYNVPANFVEMKDGSMLAIFDKNDKKTIDRAYKEFAEKCTEINDRLNVSKTDDNYFVIRDNVSGKEITFDDVPENIPTKTELVEMFKEKFGYDDFKAELAADKFAEENLTNQQKAEFTAKEMKDGNLVDSPQMEFDKIEHATLENENNLAKPYDCWYLKAKSDQKDRIVLRNIDGDFVVLEPNKMTDKQMKNAVAAAFSLEDKEVIKAIVDKANGVQEFYNKQGKEQLSHFAEFTTPDNSQKHTFDTEISRNSRDNFTADFTIKDNHDNISEYKLELSFSDKKKTISQLADMYEKFGMPPTEAKKQANEIFEKAQSQSAEKVMQIDRIKVVTPAEVSNLTETEKKSQPQKVTMDVSYGSQKEIIDISNRENALEEIQRKFGVNEEKAIGVLDKAVDQLVKNDEIETIKNLVSEEEFKEIYEENQNSETAENAEKPAEKPTTDQNEYRKPQNAIEDGRLTATAVPGGIELRNTETSKAYIVKWVKTDTSDMKIWEGLKQPDHDKRTNFKNVATAINKLGFDEETAKKTSYDMSKNKPFSSDLLEPFTSIDFKYYDKKNIIEIKASPITEKTELPKIDLPKTELPNAELPDLPNVGKGGRK